MELKNKDKIFVKSGFRVRTHTQPYVRGLKLCIRSMMCTHPKKKKKKNHIFILHQPKI